MNDITPEQTLNRRLVHGKISRGLCLEARDRIEELKNLLERWCEYYVDGMSGDDIQELYVDTLYTQENDGG